MESRVRTSLGRRPYLQQAVPFAVLAVGCTLTAIAVTTIATRERTATASAFRSDTLAVQRVVQVQLDTIASVTHAASALLAANPEISFVEFRAFIAELQLRERYPGLEGIGFAPRVAGTELRAFLRAASLDGVAHLHVRPEGPRAEYFPAVLLDPPGTDNAAMIGFDLGSEDAQRDALDRARDANAPAITPLLDANALVGRAHREFVLYIPVYRRGAAVSSIEERRRALVGFVFSRLRPDIMFSDSIAAAASSLDIAIHDNTTTPEPLLLTSGEHPANVQATAPLSIGGRQWLLTTGSREPNVAALPPEATRILATGALLSFLVFALMRAQVRAWQTSERHAAELRAADRAKDEFLATLSHELRTPLNAMLGWLAILRSGSIRDDRRAHALDIIDRNARAQAQLIDDLLEVSRILMGKMRLEKRPLSVVPAITSVIDSLRPGAEVKGVTLHGVELAKDETFVIAADVGRFAQIMTNLISNSVKFTPEGGAVWVNVAAAEGSVTISVRDTGVGISEEFLPYVFDRFRQADSSTTRSHAGMGMGLAIVRDLVRLHGGRIDAYSKGAQQGALFVVMFPMIAADDTHADSTELVLART